VDAVLQLTCGFDLRYLQFSLVVYQPEQIGRKESRAGDNQTNSSMINTRRCVIISG